MQEGNDCRIGLHTVIADDVRLGNNVVVGNHVTIYPNVTIEDDCRILDGAVIGRLTHRTRSLTRSSVSSYQPVSIGKGGVIGCHVVLYTDIAIGQAVLLGDGVSIREGCVLDDGVLLGRYVTVNYSSRIGARTRIMDSTHITGNATIGEDCFVSVLVSTTNDNDVYLRRFDLSDHDEDFVGPTLGRYVMVGSGASLNPGTRIGDGAIVGAGAVVTRDIPPWTVALGIPARPVRTVEGAWQEKIRTLATRRGQRLEGAS